MTPLQEAQRERLVGEIEEGNRQWRLSRSSAPKPGPGPVWLSRLILVQEAMPLGWGRAWTRWHSGEVVILPIPLNLLAGCAYRVWLVLVQGVKPWAAELEREKCERALHELARERIERHHQEALVAGLRSELARERRLCAEIAGLCAGYTVAEREEGQAVLVGPTVQEAREG